MISALRSLVCVLFAACVVVCGVSVRRHALLVVLTQHRTDSLLRLLRSLEAARYPPDKHIDLLVRQDRLFGNSVDERCWRAANEFLWPHGRKSVELARTYGGVRGQWLQAARLAPYTHAHFLLLEDDMELSPAFYEWWMARERRLRGVRDLAAISLHRQTLVGVQQPHEQLQYSLHVDERYPLYLYAVPGSWGVAPRGDAWLRFLGWADDLLESAERQQDARHRHEALTRVLADRVHGAWLANATHDADIWTPLFAAFCATRTLYTAYPNNVEAESLAINHRAPGVHTPPDSLPSGALLVGDGSSVFEQLTHSDDVVPRVAADGRATRRELWLVQRPRGVE